MNTKHKLNRYSARITAPRAQGASQAMLYGTGLARRADMDKAQVGIASACWYRGQPLQHASARPRSRGEGRGCSEADMIGFRFNTIGVSDGISMGTRGHELLAPVARPDRGLDRDRHGWAVVRRPGRHCPAATRTCPARVMAMGAGEPPERSWSTAARSVGPATRTATRPSTSSRPSRATAEYLAG